MMTVNEQMDLFRQGALEIVPEETLERRIKKSIETEIPLRIKMGIDPTTSDVHIGHMSGFSKMRQFQDAGHTGVVIIGDYTAQIGDPTGRNEARPSLDHATVKENAATYIDQISKVVDRDKTEFRWQSEWFEDFSLIDIIKLSSRFTVAQMLAHETFGDRVEKGDPLAIHELMYPILMAYDSVAVKADVELGGIDQKFNILMGRDLQRQSEQRPQVALFVPLLSGTGTPGVKMSKTEGNHIPVDSEAADMYGKAMSISDDQILDYFTMATQATLGELQEVEERLASEPMQLKQWLGRKLVERYHSHFAALAAEKEFDRVHRGKKSKGGKMEVPEDIREYRLRGSKPVWICEILRFADMADTNSEAKRLVEQGGVSIDSQSITDATSELLVKDGAILRVGKNRFAKLRRN